MRPVKPVYFSVDLEFTNGNVAHGEVMQVGIVCRGSGAVAQWLLPISDKASTNQWVKNNLGNMVKACMHLKLLGNDLPPVMVRERFVDAQVFGQVAEMAEWVRKERYNVAFEQTIPEPDKLEKRHPAVMVTYCGGYDFALLDKLFSQCGITNPFHYEMVDISSLAAGVLNLDWGYSEAQLLEQLGMEPNPNKHDALADAQFQLEIFEQLQAFMARRRLAEEAPLR